jgi:hypothetical protein
MKIRFGGFDLLSAASQLGNIAAPIAADVVLKNWRLCIGLPSLFV